MVRARSFRLTLAYDGAAYSGWQIQKNSPTVQAALEEALARIVNHPVRVSAAGRTDAGVHALGQVAAFQAQTRMEPDQIRASLTALLAEDIQVVGCREVEESFHPRFQALRKRYLYHVWHGFPAPLFARRHVWALKRIPDIETMEAALEVLVGEHDFASFQSTGSEVESTVRTMYRAGLEARGRLLTFSFEADGFLRHMVRALVGTLVGPDGSVMMKSILDSRDRARAGRTAPPQGLFLAWVAYPGEERPEAAPGPFSRFQ